MHEPGSLGRSRSPLLVGGIAAVGIGALVGLAFLVSSLVASNRRDVDLAYLPPDAELIVRVRVADVWNAPLLSPITKNPMVAMLLGFATAEYGLGLDDLESLTAGLSGLSDVDQDGQPVDLARLSSVRGIVVIRTKKVLPIAKLTADATRHQHGGKEYYRFDDGPGDDAVAAFFPDARTAVLGPEPSLKAAMGRSTAAARPELAFADLDQQIVIVVVPKDPAAFARAARQHGGGLAQAGDLPAELQEKVRGLSFGLTVTEGATLQMRTDCTDAESAERVKAEFERGLEQARAAFGILRAGGEPQHQEGLGLVDRMLEDAAVTRSGTTVELAAALPREARDVLARLVKQTNPLAMAGGRNASGRGWQMQGTVPVPPRAVSVDEFNAEWQVDLDVEDEPAGDVLDSLAGPLQMEIAAGREVAAALEQTVTVSMSGVSRFQAIEAVSSAVGVHPVYSAETGIELRAGPRPTPVAFAGPFVVDVSAFEIFPQYATGHVHLRLLASGLSPSTLHEFSSSRRDVFRVESASGADGQDLTNHDETIGMHFTQSANPQVFVSSKSVNLRDLLRRVETLAAVRGRVELSLPASVAQIRLDEVKNGATRRSGGLELKLQSVTRGEETTLELHFRGAEYSDLVLVPADAAGEPLPVTGAWGYGGGEDAEGQATLTVQGRPASVTGTFVTGREDVEYEFELRDVPVPRAADRPERLAALEFAGHPAPVSVDAVGLNREEHQARVRLRAVNHSNKDIRRLELQLDYLAADGEKLEDWRVQYSGESASHHESPPMAVAKSGRAEFDVTAFFMPAEARKVQARVLRVGFADGTVWEAAGND